MENEFKPVYTHKYDDIINLPHHISKKHPQMSMKQRAAQFAPFAALTGYAESIYEIQRTTTKKIELDEDIKKIINEKLLILKNTIDKNPIATLTYFIPDLKKDGGEYITITNEVIKIDNQKKLLIIKNGIEIPFSNIFDIILN